MKYIAPKHEIRKNSSSFAGVLCCGAIVNTRMMGDGSKERLFKYPLHLQQKNTKLSNSTESFQLAH